MSAMEKHRLIDQFKQITVWKSGHQRAPHKPLLLLYTLSNCLGGKSRLIPFTKIDEILKPLLIEFGPERKSYHPEYPFWRLQNDGIWELKNADNVETRKGNTDPKKSELIKHNVIGGFQKSIFKLLKANPELISLISKNILDDHFPDSMHEDILQSVGLDLDVEVGVNRDPNFRKRILVAYEYQCAVCGLSIRIGDSIVGLDAAHIKWHQAGGPDAEENGLCLCSLHHKLFDRGTFRVSSNMKIYISNLVYGAVGFNDWLKNFHNKPLKKPQHPDFYPNPDYLLWHKRNVFKGEVRYLGN